MVNNYSINGVPLFGTPGSDGRPPRLNSSAAAVQALRELSLWAERVFGLPLQHRLLDVLSALGQAEAPISLAAMARATGLDQREVQAVAAALAQRGLAEHPAGDGPATGLLPTPKLRQALAEFHDLVERAFVSRTALRESLLVNSVSHPVLAQRIERLFDRFFDLGWLYLHNWAGTCHVMAELVAQALRQQGHLTRVVWGEAAIHHGKRLLHLGRAGSARPGQFDGHLFCIVDECALVDFGLGNVRQVFRRDAVWAVAADSSGNEAMLADVRHPLVGRMCWRALPVVERWREQIDTGQRIARDLLAAVSADGTGI